MTRRGVVAALFLAIALTLPGCIAVIGGEKGTRVETPTQRVLTDLERRMDRVEQHLSR